MWQAECQIHPAVQPAHPAGFLPTGRSVAGRLCHYFGTLLPDRLLTRAAPIRPATLPLEPRPLGSDHVAISALHSTIIGPRTGGTLRIRNISGMITRNKQPMTQNASAKASMPDCFNRVPYIIRSEEHTSELQSPMYL